MFRKTLFIVIALVSVFVVGGVASAQETQESTLTFTEAQINDSFHVDASPRIRLSDEYVDLQVGQVVISATLTTRRDSYGVITMLTPSLQNGTVTWIVTAASTDGGAVSQEQINAINEAIAASWRAYIRANVQFFDITSVVITDNDMTYTGSVVPREDRPQYEVLDELIDVQDGVATLYMTEAQINDSYRVTMPRARISNVFVDLQVGQVTISETVTLLRRSSAWVVTTTYVPAIVEGDITWTMTSTSVTGEGVNDEVIQQVNDAIADSWTLYIRLQYGADATSITITDTDLTATYEYAG